MEILELIIRSGRRYGRTTACIDLVKKIGGVLVCQNEQQAKQIKKDHGIKTVAVARTDCLLGQNVPVVIDPFVYENELRSLLAKIADLKEAYGNKKEG